jgi:hypothetical protein
MQVETTSIDVVAFTMGEGFQSLARRQVKFPAPPEENGHLRNQPNYDCARGYGTEKFTLLVNALLGRVTFTGPEAARGGTVVVISEAETTLKLAAVSLKATAVVPVRFVPKMTTFDPAAPHRGCNFTNGPKPADKRKTVPQPPELRHLGLLPPLKVVP